MAVIHFAHRELSAKVVYFGATGAGCNTNLRQLHVLVQAEDRSDLHEFGPADANDASRYFEFWTNDCNPISDFGTRFRMYSLPGGILHPGHRREVLRDVDALVFVADARADRSQANLEALMELERLLSDLGRNAADIPTVIQVNHADADNHRATERVVFDLNPHGFSVVAANALSGEGVIETQKALQIATQCAMNDALTGTETAMVFSANHTVDRDHAEAVVARHMEQIEEGEANGGIAVRDADLRALPAGPVVELPYLSTEFIGSRPIRVLGSEVQDDAILIEVVMARLSGNDPRKLTLRLANRPVGSSPVTSITKAHILSKEDHTTSVMAQIPEKVDLSNRSFDFPPVWYGVVGGVAGIVVGMLLGFLLLA